MTGRGPQARRHANHDASDPYVRSSDPDGDGPTGPQEWVAGTDPRDPLSFFRIEAVDAGPPVILRGRWRTRWSTAVVGGRFGASAWLRAMLLSARTTDWCASHRSTPGASSGYPRQSTGRCAGGPRCSNSLVRSTRASQRRSRKTAKERSVRAQIQVLGMTASFRFPRSGRARVMGTAFGETDLFGSAAGTPKPARAASHAGGTFRAPTPRRVRGPADVPTPG